jgi:hypothetical protein
LPAAGLLFQIIDFAADSAQHFYRIYRDLWQ